MNHEIGDNVGNGAFIGNTQRPVAAGSTFGAFIVASTIGGALIIILLISLLIFYIRRKVCLVHGKTQPVSKYILLIKYPKMSGIEY